MQLSKQQCPGIPFLHNTYIFLAIAAFHCVFTEQGEFTMGKFK